jgi:hypothetical protein
VDQRSGFPQLVQVDTASGSAKIVLDHQAAPSIPDFHPATGTTANRYAQARRIRQGAKRGVVLLPPAGQWTTGR